MWSKPLDDNPGSSRPSRPGRDQLLVARGHMARALALLDSHSSSAAAASLDMALHQLDRELSGG